MALVISKVFKMSFFFTKSRHFLPKKSHSELKLGCFELEKTRNLFFVFFSFIKFVVSYSLFFTCLRFVIFLVFSFNTSFVVLLRW